MKGVILAGGTGSRLAKLTTVLNKHLVAVGDVPMIEYPLATLRRAGITDITIVTGAEHAGTIMNYLTKEYPELDFTFKVQKTAGGIAQALGLTKNVCEGHKVAVILGDNIFEDDFGETARRFEASNAGVMLFLKKVPDPHRFGVAEIEAGKIIGVEEKPKVPKSDLAVTGLYFFDATVFAKIAGLKPSARGEYELTDVNAQYVRENRALHNMIPGFWSDAGTPESRKHAQQYVYDKGTSHFLD